MPVAPTRHTPARQAFLVGLGAAMGLVALLFLVTQADRLLGGVSDVDLQLGDGVFRPGEAEQLATDIGNAGEPLLLPDLAGGDRDIYLQHLGDDPEEGWAAFAVRPQTAPRTCAVVWQPGEQTFVDSCDGTIYPADGEGLPQFPVSVDAEGNLTVLLDTAPVQGDDDGSEPEGSDG